MATIPLARAAALHPFLNWMTENGIPVERSLRRAKLEGFTWDRPEVSAPLRNMLDFTGDIANRHGLKDLGFRVFSEKTLGGFGTTGEFIAEAFTPRAALERAARAMTYFCPHEHICVGTDPSNPVVQVSFDDTLTGDGTHLAQQLTSMVFSALVDAAGCGRKQLMRAEISKCDGVTLDMVRPWLGDNVSWSEAGALRLHFRPGALDRPFPRPISEPDETVNRTAMWLNLKEAPSLVEALRIQIEEMLIEGEPSVKQMADAVGMSTRTLQRRLAELDTSFSDLLDDVRYVNAMAEISGSSQLIGSISTELGYSAQACFSRAVRRWEARTARDIRSEATRNQ